MPNRRPLISRLALAAAIASGLGVTRNPFADTAVTSAHVDGLALFREAARRDSGYADFKAAMEMEITPQGGTMAKRWMRLCNLEPRGDGAKSLLTLVNPPEVKGAMLLTHAHRSSADEVWLFLPGSRRAKKIRDKDRPNSFLAGDFTYEDMLALNPQPEKFSYAVLPSEILAGLPCFVVERKPKYPRSGYSKEVVWLDTTDYLIRKIDYYGGDGKPVKILSLDGYAFYGGHWRVREMEMRDLTNGSRTVLRASEYAFGTKPAEAMFDPKSLGK